MELFDSAGTVFVKDLASGTFTSGNSHFLFSSSGISSGTYTYKLLSGTSVVKTGSVVIP
jgi:hypothetical protein